MLDRDVVLTPVVRENGGPISRGEQHGVLRDHVYLLGVGYCCFSHWQLGNDGISCHLWMLYMALFSGAYAKYHTWEARHSRELLPRLHVA